MVLWQEEQRVCRPQSTPLSGSLRLVLLKRQPFNRLHIVSPERFVLTTDWQTQPGDAPPPHTHSQAVDSAFQELSEVVTVGIN